jgi:N-formylglutamate deformylase
MMPDWLGVTQRDAPLIVSLPHTGTTIDDALLSRFVSPWRARKDCDWHIERLYDVADGLGATMIRTAISRSVIDVNRDPAGQSLYPGQATTELCPTTTFDGEPLYREDDAPDAAEIMRRRATYFDPYHAALAGEIERLRARHPRIVVYDAHSIRSRIPRLFEGELPVFNIGTNGGVTCAASLQNAVERACDATGLSRVSNGRFKGGYITRRYGRPEAGVHAIQMELACRGYLREPPGAVSEADWPADYDPAFAAPMQEALAQVLRACLDFATDAPQRQ